MATASPLSPGLVPDWAGDHLGPPPDRVISPPSLLTATSGSKPRSGLLWYCGWKKVVQGNPCFGTLSTGALFLQFFGAHIFLLVQ